MVSYVRFVNDLWRYGEQNMILKPIPCLTCGEEDVVKHGKTETGLCRNLGIEIFQSSLFHAYPTPFLNRVIHCLQHSLALDAIGEIGRGIFSVIESFHEIIHQMNKEMFEGD